MTSIVTHLTIAIGGIKALFDIPALVFVGQKTPRAPHHNDLQFRGGMTGFLQGGDAIFDLTMRMKIITNRPGGGGLVAHVAFGHTVFSGAVDAFARTGVGLGQDADGRNPRYSSY